jgi:glyoxylase-like metal-dependent hydrolase (beta-lactamase superfamily II)
MKLFNSAYVNVFAGLLRSGGGLTRVKLTVRYGLIELATGGLCLVDTGFGPEVTQGPRSAALRLYNAVLRPELIPDQSPLSLLRSMGARPDDIRLMLVTHFHADHIASLRAFPNVRLIACGEAARAVEAMRPAAALHHGIFRELLPPDFTQRIVPLQGLPRRPTGTVLGDGYDLFGDGAYLAIPLPGHAFGHFGLFWRENGAPVLYATDAAWTLQALLADKTPWISRALVFDDRAAGRSTEALLRTFARNGGTIRLCHDLEET